MKFPNIMSILSKGEQRRRASVKKRNLEDIEFHLREVAQPVRVSLSASVPEKEPQSTSLLQLAQQDDFNQCRIYAQKLAAQIKKCVPDAGRQELILSKLEEALHPMWFNKL
jgi:hypothetical protein